MSLGALRALWGLFAAGVAGLVVVFLCARNDYRRTYVTAYRETEATRMGLAEHLRRLPMSFFNQRDLSELTENLMGDVSSRESLMSSTIPQLVASCVSTAVVCVMLAFFEWRLALFVFSMTGLVLAANFILLYAFWEGVGLCSYLLVGFWFAKPAAADAARKAFLVTRLGDVGFFIGILVLWWHFGGTTEPIADPALFPHQLEYKTVFANARHVHPIWVQAAVVMAALPPALNIFVLSTQYRVGIERASACVLVGTVVSIVTLTGVLWLFRTGAVPVLLFR